MAIISLKNSTLFSTAKGFAIQKTTGAVPLVPVPTFTSATTSSYTVAITGYDAQFTYTVSASVGSAVRTGGNVTVSGLTANQSSTLTVTAANADSTKGLSFTSSAAFLSLPATPTLIQATENATGGTVTITNYDAAVTYTISITAGSASRTGDTITFTGLTRGQTATLSVTASNSSGSTPTATLAVSAEPLGEFESIATIVVPSGGMSSITFNNIPQDYQHLQLRFLLRNTWAINKREEVRLRLNNDSGSNYARHGLEGDGSVASAFGSASQTSMGAGALGGDALTASVFSAGIIDILDYTNTSKTKTMRALTGVDGNGEGWLWMRSGLWNSTSAITTVTLSSDNGQTLKQHSTVALYGVKA